MNIHDRLEEMGLFYRMGGTSADFSGSDVLQGLVDGDPGGSGLPGSAGPWIASRVAETARACLSLHEDDQATIVTCYCEPLANQALQAAALNIKPSALQKRLHRIHLLLDDWLTPEAKEKRRLDALFLEMQANAQVHVVRAEEIRKRADKAQAQREARKSGRKPGTPKRASKVAAVTTVSANGPAAGEVVAISGVTHVPGANGKFEVGQRSEIQL